MIIEISKDTKPETLKAVLKKIPQKPGLRQFVGKLKRGLDGLKYQNDARNES